MQRLVGDTLKDDIEAETGIRPGWATESFRDPYQNVRQSIRRLQVNPFIQHKDLIRGFVYRVEDGHLDEAGRRVRAAELAATAARINVLKAASSRPPRPSPRRISTPAARSPSRVGST